MNDKLALKEIHKKILTRTPFEAISILQGVGLSGYNTDRLYLVQSTRCDCLFLVYDKIANVWVMLDLTAWANGIKTRQRLILKLGYIIPYDIKNNAVVVKSAGFDAVLVEGIVGIL